MTKQMGSLFDAAWHRPRLEHHPEGGSAQGSCICSWLFHLRLRIQHECFLGSADCVLAARSSLSLLLARRCCRRSVRYERKDTPNQPPAFDCLSDRRANLSPGFSRFQNGMGAPQQKANICLRRPRSIHYYWKRRGTYVPYHTRSFTVSRR
jgi:hypothetical protein